MPEKIVSFTGREVDEMAVDDRPKTGESHPNDEFYEYEEDDQKKDAKGKFSTVTVPDGP